METLKQDIAPSRRVPAAKIQFLPEDRAWIAGTHSVAVLRDWRDRKALKTLLREQYGVSLAGEVYEEPLHKQPVCAPYVSRSLPVSEDYCARHLCLPIFSGMEEQDAQQVIHALREIIG